MARSIVTRLTGTARRAPSRRWSSVGIDVDVGIDVVRLAAELLGLVLPGAGSLGLLLGGEARLLGLPRLRVGQAALLAGLDAALLELLLLPLADHVPPTARTTMAPITIRTITVVLMWCSLRLGSGRAIPQTRASYPPRMDAD